MIDFKQYVEEVSKRIIGEEVKQELERPVEVNIAATDEFMVKIEALDDFMLLSMYFAKLDEIKDINIEKGDLNKSLNSIKIPDVVENLYDYQQTVRAKQELEERVNSSLEENTKRLRKALNEKGSLKAEIFKREEMPLRSWIKVGDNAIWIGDKEMETKPWHMVVREKPEVQKAEKKSKLAVTALGAGTSILVAGGSTVAALLYFDWIVASIMLLVWLFVGKAIDKTVEA